MRNTPHAKNASGGVTPDGLAYLRALPPGKHVILLCKEQAPGDCHRHHHIALRLLPKIDVLHIFEEEVVEASELQRAIDDDDYYHFTTL